MPHTSLSPAAPVAAKPRGNPNLALARRRAVGADAYRARRIAARSTQRAARTTAADRQALAAHAAGLRAPANRPPQGAPTPGPTAPFKPFRTNPFNRGICRIPSAAKCPTNG
jgi:hypothetical protein